MDRDVPLLSLEADFVGTSNESEALEAGRTNNESDPQHKSRRKSPGLDTFDGVYMPCVSSILGAVLFLRLSWAVGQAGWGGVLLMLVVGTFVNIMTALSLAAISTNGSMKGGGAYFMISRSIGPEFGIAVGVVYTVALTFGATFSLMAFAENFVDSILCNQEPCSQFHQHNRWLCFGVASIALGVLLVCSMAGARAMTKMSSIVTLVMLASIAFGALSLLTSHGISNMSVHNFKHNAWFAFTDARDPASSDDGQQSFLTVFVIVFPAMTGIMAGANYSGSLKDPAKSIGTGTLGAIFSTAALYIFLIFLFGVSLDRVTLQNNKSAFQQASIFPPFIVVGIMSCTISSAFGNLLGAAKILQALSRDNLLTVFNQFGQGSPKDDTPQKALLLCSGLAQVCLLYGKLDAIAAIVTDCFLLVYLFLNVSCFALKITGAPNFRPRFAYFSWHTALAGAISALVCIFVTSPLNGLISLTLTLTFAYYVHVTAPVVPWGSVTQALIFHSVRKYLLLLDSRRSHPKFWRPSILFIPEYEEGQLALVDFCNNLKKGGLYVIGSILVDTSPTNQRKSSYASLSNMETSSSRSIGQTILKNMPNVTLAASRLEQLWIDLLRELNAKAFNEILIAPSLVAGVRCLLMSAGLGGLRPNTVCMQFFKYRGSGNDDGTESVSSVSAAASYNSNAVYDFQRDADSISGGVARNDSFSTLQFGSSVHNYRAGLTSQQQQQQQTEGYMSFGDAKSSETLSEIQTLLKSYRKAGKSLTEQELDFCEMIADVLVLEKNLLIARYFEGLDKDAIMECRSLRRRASSVRSFSFKSPTKFRFKFRTSTNLDSDTESVFNSGEGYESASDCGHSTPGGGPSLNRFTTIDLWSTDESDWNDPAGTLALEMQLAYGLHRTDIWEDHTKLRVIAACQSVTGAHGSEEARSTAKMAYQTLRKLLKAIRVEAEVIVLPAVGAALFEEHAIDDEDEDFNNQGVDSNEEVSAERPRRLTVKRCPRTEPLTQLEHCAELNAMVLEHSSEKACVVFLPLPRPPTHSRINPENASEYLENLRVLSNNLPPLIMCAPGSNISPIVTTEL